MSQTDVLNPLDRFGSVTLDELDAVAALQTRVDRKYVLSPAQVEALLDRVDPTVRVLDVDGRRRFAYESVYFDTPRLDSFHLAARRRPNRFKVRTRTYLDASQCMLEVKLRNSFGQTVKHRIDHEIAQQRELTDEADAFLDGFEALARLRGSLRPTLLTHYERTTLLWDASRATLDVDVTCRSEAAPSRAARFGQRAIVETKCVGAVGPVDRILWSIGERPVAVSKYATGLAALRPDLPRNRWHRTLARYVDLDD